jgi:Fur family ferric uptake transcriptional regulator
MIRASREAVNACAMTVAALRTSDVRLEEALARLRACGLRASAARRLVLECLAAAEGPITVGAVAGGLDGRVPPSDLGSVYRIVETFEREGLVHRVHLGGGPARYELDSDDEREYLLCEACGVTKAVDPAVLDDVRRHVRARFGLMVRFSRFPMAGLCSRCAGAHPPR